MMEGVERLMQNPTLNPEGPHTSMVNSGFMPLANGEAALPGGVVPRTTRQRSADLLSHDFFDGHLVLHAGHSPNVGDKLGDQVLLGRVLGNAG